MLTRVVRWFVFPIVLLSLVSSQACQDRITNSGMDEIQTRYTRTEELAKKGDAKAQFDFGVWCESEIPPNDVEALNWFRKSAEQGYAPAQYKVGYAYAIGQSVSQNDSEAVKWYRMAAEQGDADAVAALARKSSGTKLFGISLKNASRKDLRAAVKKQGAAVKSEDDNKWGDSYDSEAILSGSTVLSVIYTNDDRFAGATYTFPGFMDAQLIVKVKEMVESKYGAPGRSSGNPGLGEVSYHWNLKDGIRISVFRGWPNTTTYLEYVDPDNHRKMKAEMAAQQQQNDAQKYQAQEKVF